ncbi:MAG: hypothetical protein OEZ42_11295, partial [Gemmatimonadota bacterium]|nr:hypothetical protein [Gemmatimonadota bacterium]
MIRLNHPERLPPLEQYGVTVLLDLSRLLVVADEYADVVTVSVVDDAAAGGGDLSSLETDRWGIRIRQGGIDLPRGLLELTRNIVGAAVEQRSQARDRFDRVPPGENPLVAAGRWE